MAVNSSGRRFSGFIPQGGFFVFLVEKRRKWRLHVQKTEGFLQHSLFGHQIEHSHDFDHHIFALFFWVIFGHKKPRVSCPRLALKGEFHQKGAKMEVRWNRCGGCWKTHNSAWKNPAHYGSMGRRLVYLPIWITDIIPISWPQKINLPFM